MVTRTRLNFALCGHCLSYNRDGVRLLRGTVWIFKYNAGKSCSSNGHSKINCARAAAEFTGYFPYHLVSLSKILRSTPTLNLCVLFGYKGDIYYFSMQH
jgi:hypothetical protein